MDRKIPAPHASLTMPSDSDVFVVKYNADGNYCMTGHADRSVKVRQPRPLLTSYQSSGMQIRVLR